MLEPACYSSPEDTFHRRMVVNLTVTTKHECFVRSCELKDRNFRNRTSFGEGAYLEHVFCDAVARALKSGITSLQGKSEVLSIPSVLVEIPGLTLVGLHLIVTKLKDATLNVIARFGSFIGGINRAFAHNIGFDDYLTEEKSVLTTKVLEDIALPLLDICAFAENDLATSDPKLRHFGVRLTEQSLQLRFKIELLKRFIDQEKLADQVSTARNQKELDLSRLHAAPSARVSQLPIESDLVFQA